MMTSEMRSSGSVGIELRGKNLSVSENTLVSQHLTPWRRKNQVFDLYRNVVRVFGAEKP